MERQEPQKQKKASVSRSHRGNDGTVDDGDEKDGEKNNMHE